MERMTDPRTLGVVLWAKHFSNNVMGVLLLCGLNFTLNSFLRSLTAPKLDALSHEEALELTKDLREICGGLNEMLERNVMCLLKRKRIFAKLIDRIEEHTEDLHDILEGLTLSENADFRALIGDCAKELSAKPHNNQTGYVRSLKKDRCTCFTAYVGCVIHPLHRPEITPHCANGKKGLLHGRLF